VKTSQQNPFIQTFINLFFAFISFHLLAESGNLYSSVFYASKIRLGE